MPTVAGRPNKPPREPKYKEDLDYAKAKQKDDSLLSSLPAGHDDEAGAEYVARQKGPSGDHMAIASSAGHPHFCVHQYNRWLQ